MKWTVLLIFLYPFSVYACLPNEIHVREQWIDSYLKEDGTKVSAHLRSDHCREMTGHNYFQDSSSKEFKNFKGKFKSWKVSEKNLISLELEKLPYWLQAYKLANLLRASTHEGNIKNPALTYPGSKTLILFDAFFDVPNKKDILLHEISHIAIWDVDPNELQNFLSSNGWTYKKGESPKPPKKVILPDSVQSPSEDFANSIEMYYSNPSKLRNFNSNSFQIIEKIIKSKEKR